ncbi:hypothetical protein DFH08DRAFT_617191, partial [Mycena albidolilacea]
YRCRECKGGVLFCRECCVSHHLENPLHIVEVSVLLTLAGFVLKLFRPLSLRVQFGHPPGEYCAGPEAGRQGFVVLHNNGIHEVNVDFCGCEHRGCAGALDTKLLRGGWYPAS